MRNRTGPVLTKEQITALKEQLDSLGENDNEKIGIVRQAFAAGWKSFWPIKKKPRKQSRSKMENLHNFEQREYDMESLEKKLLKKQLGDEYRE